MPIVKMYIICLDFHLKEVRFNIDLVLIPVNWKLIFKRFHLWKSFTCIWRKSFYRAYFRKARYPCDTSIKRYICKFWSIQRWNPFQKNWTTLEFWNWKWSVKIILFLKMLFKYYFLKKLDFRNDIAWKDWMEKVFEISPVLQEVNKFD